MFEVGDKVQHRHNSDLGPGEIRAISGSRMTVYFPREELTLEFARNDEAFLPLRLREGADPERWHEEFHLDIIERLARLETDDLDAFQNRLDALRLSGIREADGLGSFLGGRIEVFPHQLHVAEQACRVDPVRWLLADEVGLGKTVEACLILNRLLRTGRAERVIVAVPRSLTVQWLGELYRKFHQNFILLDPARRRDLERDLGPEFNPFEVHARSVVAYEELAGDAKLAGLAVAATPDLLVIDEAHRLERRAGHPGSPLYRALAPITDASRHCLLLSATPLEADAHGYFRLLELLRPDLFDSWEAFRGALDRGDAVAACASSTRREDIGGLPPRVPRPVPLPPWPAMDAAVAGHLAEPARDALARRRIPERVEEAFSRLAGDDDPRVAWLLERERKWHARGDKVLVFVHERRTLDELKKRIEGETFRRVAVFHEDLTPAAGDLEVAGFALESGPTLLISTEAGGEGRNFEFCAGIVLFDLPWDPVIVEQRIGRLDRISRKQPVRIHYFVPHDGFGRQVAELYEELGIFSEPLGGLDRSLGEVRSAVREACLATPAELDVTRIVSETQQAREAIHRALYRNIHRDRYQARLADEILARIPADLEVLTSEVIREACRQYGFQLIEKPGADCWYVEFGAEATVEALAGVPEGTRFLGTFDRAEAVARESIEFFASGHPLVEGVFMELDDGRRGEVALLEIEGTGVQGLGLLGMVKRGAEIEPVIVDLAGRPQPDWILHLLSEDPRWRAGEPGAWGMAEGTDAREVWATRTRELLRPLQDRGRIRALAGVRLLP